MKVAQSCQTLCNPMDYTVHGILQARILEWVAFSFSRSSSQLSDRTQVSCIAGEFFTSWVTGKAHRLKWRFNSIQLKFNSSEISFKLQDKNLSETNILHELLWKWQYFGGMLSLALTWQEENICRDCNSRMKCRSTKGEKWITTEYVKHLLKRQRNETIIMQLDSLPTEPEGKLKITGVDSLPPLSRPRNWAGVSCIARVFFTSWAMREVQEREKQLKTS